MCRSLLNLIDEEGNWQRDKFVFAKNPKAKVNDNDILQAFEMGAEGVFIAGCGDQCARENTDFWVRQRVNKVRKVLSQIGLEPDRIQAVVSAADDQDLSGIGGYHIASIMTQEVKS